jgi:hypothetical protein
MAQTPTLDEVEAEMRRRGLLTVSGSVMDEPGTTLKEFQNFGESLFKGGAKGVIDILGGWGNLYDYLKKSNDPNAFSSAGISRGIRNLTGVDLLSIPGYKGAYEFSSAGTPAAALTAVGVPGLFGRTKMGVTGEYGVGGATGLFAGSVAPESPAAQLALGMTPYATKASYLGAQRALTQPRVTMPSVAETTSLLSVGRLTPGEAALDRGQLATEARTEASTRSGQAPVAFRQGQAIDVEGFLDRLFQRSAGAPVTLQRAEATTQAVFDAFRNYGKALSSKLRSDASKDFNAAKSAGGMIDTTPVVNKVRQQLASIAPEEPGFAQLKSSLDRILTEYVEPGKPATTTTSTVLGPGGTPASTIVTPATPDVIRSIDIKRLQDNLAIWGDAAYSGKATIGGSNIFEGVAPGKAKGIALNVLRGFKESLDVAIQNGVPGADKLAKARDNFATNIRRIEEFSNRPLTKAFDVEAVTDLVPEKVLAKLKKEPESQRNFLIEVMSAHPNPQVTAVLDTIRRSTLDDILMQGRTSGSALDPAVSINNMLKALQKKGDLAALFPNAADLAEAQLAVKYMQRVLSRESAAGAVGPSAGTVYSLSRGAGGTATQSLVLKELGALVDSLIASPEAFSRVLFEGDNRKLLLDLAKGKTKGEKAYNAVQTLAKGLAVTGARGGPMVEVTQPNLPAPAPTYAPEPAAEPQLSDIEEEMRRRGLME